MALAGTRLDRTDPVGGLLAIELDAAGRPDGLSVLSAVARIHFGGRCGSAEAHRQFSLDSVAQEFRAAFFGIRTGVVAV
jgi:hypothetical protein